MDSIYLTLFHRILPKFKFLALPERDAINPGRDPFNFILVKSDTDMLCPWEFLSINLDPLCIPI